MQKLDPSYITGGSVKMADILGISFTDPQNFKHRVIIWPSNSSECIPQSFENIHSWKMCTQVIRAMFVITVKKKKTGKTSAVYDMAYYLAI